MKDFKIKVQIHFSETLLIKIYLTKQKHANKQT